MFSGNSPCLLGQHGSCSSAQLEVSENILQNPFLNLPPQTVDRFLHCHEWYSTVRVMVMTVEHCTTFPPDYDVSSLTDFHCIPTAGVPWLRRRSCGWRGWTTSTAATSTTPSRRPPGTRTHSSSSTHPGTRTRWRRGEI